MPVLLNIPFLDWYQTNFIVVVTIIANPGRMPLVQNGQPLAAPRIRHLGRCEPDIALERTCHVGLVEIARQPDDIQDGTALLEQPGSMAGALDLVECPL